MSIETPAIDLEQLEPILAKYAHIPGSLITILQETQDLYGYLPQPALQRISEQTGETVSYTHLKGKGAVLGKGKINHQ